MSNINCSKISVDCVVNDPVDVRAGGPQYLGFDFFVREEETEEMKEFISTALNNLEVPLASIYVSEFIKIDVQDVWTKSRIIECIQKQANYLKREAARNYKPVIRNNRSFR